MARKKKDLSDRWKVNLPGLLKEMVDYNKGMEIFRTPANILQGILGELATYAADKDDPMLNIFMLRLALYDVPLKDTDKEIDKQMRRMRNGNAK